jgi:hypothetical protein
MTRQSRRSFLIDSALGLSSTWVMSNWSGILEAKAFADQAAAGQPPDFAFFTNEEGADIDAMASQVIPTDETPGAHEARCVNFIDYGLTTFLQESQPIYREGLKALQAKTRELAPDAGSFTIFCATDSGPHGHRAKLLLHNGPHTHDHRDVCQSSAWGECR